MNGKGISWEELRAGSHGPQAQEEVTEEVEERDQVGEAHDTPVLRILQDLSSQGQLTATPEEIKQLALALTHQLSEDIVRMNYGAPISRRVINWLEGRAR
jgi:hypothetical protein